MLVVKSTQVQTPGQSGGLMMWLHAYAAAMETTRTSGTVTRRNACGLNAMIDRPMYILSGTFSYSGNVQH